MVRWMLDWVYNVVLRHPVIFWACMAANMVGVVWGGWIWYGPQLAQAPLWAWPFIPDCPAAALYATVAFVALRYGRAQSWFTAFAAFACVKYGLWTVAFWLRHWSEAGFVAGYWPLEVMLFVAHIGLTCEGLILATRVGPLGLPARLGVAGWFALSVFVDYALGHHPPLTYAVPQEFAFGVAAALTAALGAGMLLVFMAARGAHTGADGAPIGAPLRRNDG